MQFGAFSLGKEKKVSTIIKMEKELQTAEKDSPKSVVVITRSISN